MALMSSLTDPFTADPDAAVWTITGDASLGGDGSHVYLYSASLRSVAAYEFDSASVRIQGAGLYTGTFDFTVSQDETTENPWPDNRAMWMSVTPSTGWMNLWWQGYGDSWAADDPPTMSWPDFGGYLQVAYDPDTMAYLRMTNTVVGGQLVATYLASADGLTWSTLYQFTADPETTYPYRPSMGVFSGWAQLGDFNLTGAGGSTFGDGEFGSGTFGAPELTVTPDGLALTLALDAPEAAYTYYVDSVAGDDANAGTTPSAPWQTIAKVNSVAFAPGDKILFKRGSTWAAADLVIDTAGTSAKRIVFGAYGTGANPVLDGGGATTPISCGGAWTTIQDLTCRNAGGAEKVGIAVSAADVLVQRVYVTGCALGIQVYAGGDRCRITASNISDNDVLLIGPGDNDDYGGQGVTVLRADSVEIDHNTLDRNLCPSVDYGFAPQGFRSGLPWISGAYLDHNADNIDLFETRGRRLDAVEVFVGAGSAAAMVDTWWVPSVAPVTDAGGRVLVSVPLWAADQNVNTDTTTLFTELGQMLTAQGLNDKAIVRLGWEMNIDFGHWSVFASNRAAWVADFQRAVNLLRTHAPGVQICFNPNEGPSNAGRLADIDQLAIDLLPYYEWVGIDFYNWDSSMNTVAGWNARYAAGYGMQHWEDFARAHDKGFAVPEWGGMGDNTASDNVVYTQQMIARVAALAESGMPVFESYFNEYDAGWRGTITPYREYGSGDTQPAQLPVLGAAYTAALADIVLPGGEDGSAVEVFGATNLLVHHNSSDGSQTFTELGDPVTGDCVFHDNVITGSHDRQLGFNVQGTGAYGPLTGTSSFYNNTVLLTGAGTVALYVGEGSPAVAHNNIFWATNGSSTFGHDIDEGHNVWYGAAPVGVWSTANSGVGIAASSIVADPLFVSTTNLHLRAGSPAIDLGVSNYGHTLDFDGHTRPASGVDAGAYERVTTPATITPDGLDLPVTLGSPSTLPPGAVSPDGIALDLLLGAPTAGRAGRIDAPIVPPPGYRTPALPVHLLGIGPWNTTVAWGVPNHGVSSRARASVPLLDLPMADSKSVTLRLGEGSEARSSHYFPRRRAILIEEKVTDLWWRRRDPHRGIVDRIGRFNAATVDIDKQTDGGVNVSATYVDYQALLEDRLILRYLTPSAVPPTTMWNTGTPITEILRWAVPTNLGLDLSGLQIHSPDITYTLKHPYQLPLGTRLEDVFKQLVTASTKTWEWWVEMPASDIARPRLTLAPTRGHDRGVILFDVGTLGPIAAWSLQKSGDKYANTLYFIGHDGGVVVDYKDQIALYGQRDATDSNDSVLATKDGAGKPYLLNAAAQHRLAELAAGTPSYQIVLQPGFWEGRTHIDVGDQVTIHLELGNHVIGGKYRVSELQLSVDGNGLETVTLTLGTKRPSADPRSRASNTARVVRYLKTYVVPPGA